MTIRTISSAMLALGAGAILAIAAPLAASAHVSVDPGSAEPGSYAVITFKVPTESESAQTTKLEVTLPADTPFASVRYVPVPGWTTELESTVLDEPVTVADREIAEAVTKVTWTAEPGVGIAAGQLQLFSLSVGPVPETGSIVLTADQTYSDGSIVSWSESGEDAEYPAPVLFVTDAPVDHHGGGAESPSESPAASTGSSDDVLARAFGIGGLALGAAALVIANVSRRRAADGTMAR